MAGWTWCVIGLVLFVAEVVIPSGFFLSFMGVSSLLVGVITFAGVALSWPTQTFIFCISSVALWFTFGSKMRTLLRTGASQSDSTTGKIVSVLAAVAPGEIGTGELWGSQWRIKNVDDRPLSAGSEAVVVHAEGVTLHVRVR